MKIFLSGWHSSRVPREAELIASGFSKHRGFAFATIQKLADKQRAAFTYAPWQQGIYDLNVQRKIGIMMDSSAVGYRHIFRRNGYVPPTEILTEPYIEFCKQEAHKWDLYFTLDLEVSCPYIFEMQKKLFKLGLKPTPVYHGEAGLDYLKRYVDMGSTVIGISSPKRFRGSLSAKRRFLDACFKAAERWNFKIHGLAMTSVWQLLAYPFDSVDSSSWTRCATTGCLMKFNPSSQRVSIMHVSDRDSAKKVTLSRDAKRVLEREFADEGFDYQKLHTDLVTRHIYNAATMLQIGAFAEKRRKGSWELLWE